MEKGNCVKDLLIRVVSNGKRKASPKGVVALRRSSEWSG